MRPILRFLLVCLLIGGFFRSYSQVLEQVYVVKLHKGWEVKGWLENEPGKVKVRTRTDNIFVFDSAEVRIIEPQIVAKRDFKPIDFKRGLFSYPAPGYTGMITLSNLNGTRNQWGDNVGVNTFDLQFVNSYRFAHWLTVGGGTGVSLFPRGPLMPLYADIRADLLPKRMTPHAYFRGGYSLPLYKNEDWTDRFGNDREGSASGGAMLEMGVGMRLYSFSGVSWLVSLGFRQQATRDVFQDWGGNVISESQVFQRVSISLSLSY